MKTVLTLVLVCCTVLPLSAEMTLPDVLAGKAAPLTITVKELDGTWRVFKAGEQGGGISTLLAMSFAEAVSVGACTYYTHGQVLTAGTQTYLVAYCRPLPPVDLQAMQHGPPQPTPLTRDTVLALSLLDLRTLGSLVDIHPVEMPKLLGDSVKTTTAVNEAKLKADEARLRANLRQLRNAIEQFHVDTGVFPETLFGLIAQSGTRPKGADGKPVAEKAYIGPYLDPMDSINKTGIKLNPFVDPGDTDVTHHWRYDPAKGTITVPVSLANRKTLDGDAYGAL